MATSVSSPESGIAKAPFFKVLDPVLMLFFVGLMTCSLYSAYSLSIVPGTEVNFRKTILHVLLGIAPFTLFLLTPCRIWQKIAKPIYVLNLVLLASVFFFGSKNGGAVRWLDIGFIEFQPSEFTKIATAITVSTFFTARSHRLNHLSVFGMSLLHIAPSLVLLAAQPHMGGVMTVLVTWGAIAAIAGVPWKYLLTLIGVMVALVSVSLNTNFLLRDYHRERIQAIFSGDDSDSRYQVLRATLAFGVGGVEGTGPLQGDQKQSRAIPEQHSDFVMTVIGEEGGLAGTSLLLFLFAGFFLRAWDLVRRIPDPWMCQVGFGIITMLAFHWIVNVQMNLGIGPVIGLWLPFISSGGTALWLCMGCTGLLLQLARQRQDMIFATSGWSLMESAQQQSRKTR